MGIKEYFGKMTTLLVDVHDAELKAALQAALLEAQGEALDLQEKLAKLQEENSELRAERDARDDVAEVADKLYFARQAYWREDEKIFSAYCPTCWDTKRQLVRLTPSVNQTGICVRCKFRFTDVFRGERPTRQA